MIFQHTIDSVLAGRKSQTSRLWKEDWAFPHDEYDSPVCDYVYSLKSYRAGGSRRPYRVGQTLAIQPARGKAGVGKIRITGLAKRDVRDFTSEDIRREGFSTTKSSFVEFYRTWYSMHFPQYVRLLDEGRVTEDWWLDAMKAQVAAKNMALVINFELVQEGERA
jgi:hypothetical protein